MLTRRQFAAASAGLLAGSLVSARSAPAFSFALITDTHLSKPGADYGKRMRSAVAEVNASPAAFTVFCGALVDRGEAEANQKRYGEWLDIAKGLKNEYTAVPGNHDPAALFTKHIRKETESVLDCKDYRILCFADAEPNPGHLGIVTEGQMKWLQARLDEAKKKDQRVILAAHVIYHARMRHGLPRKATGRIFCLLAALLRGERDPTGSTWLSCGTRGGGAVGHEGQAAGGQR